MSDQDHQGKGGGRGAYMRRPAPSPPPQAWTANLSPRNEILDVKRSAPYARYGDLSKAILTALMYLVYRV